MNRLTKEHTPSASIDKDKSVREESRRAFRFASGGCYALPSKGDLTRDISRVEGGDAKRVASVVKGKESVVINELVDGRRVY